MKRDNSNMPCGVDESSLGSKSDLNQEAKLFQALNLFIALVSTGGSDRAPTNKDSGSDNKASKNLANFLRLNLLSYLRHCQQYTNKAPTNREVLIQWWITLLNFLNSELIVNGRNGEGEALQDRNFKEPIWNIDTVSVSLECVSRLMSTLIVLPQHHYREAEIYSHHILLTIHCVTNQIIFNSKHIRILSAEQSVNKRYLSFLKDYSTLLRAFLGKLNAYAYFYLPDDFHYDTQLLLVIHPQLTFKSSPRSSLFPWKRRKFEITDDESNRINTDELENRDTRFFKIVVSYMKNESIFIAFYWHYWYIVLRCLSFVTDFGKIRDNLDIIPGSSVLLNHVTCAALSEDLRKLHIFLKMSHSKGTQTNNGASLTADTMPDSTVSITMNEHVLTTEMLNDFVFTSFSTIKLWECLRSLSGCFSGNIQLIELLSIHDAFQLQYISGISAYDGHTANVIYNKVLQFIIFQFKCMDSIDFINWEKWTSGLLAMLNTFSANCQIVALVCLFNIWGVLPTQVQLHLSRELLSHNWDSLALDSDFHLVKVIFFKFLVFRMLSAVDHKIKEEVKEKLQLLYGEMLSIHEETNEIANVCKGDILSFYGNKKFFLMPNKCQSEDFLINKVDKRIRTKNKAKSRNFPSIINVANIRPSFVLKNGRYPYDVLDEMVVKATLLLSEKKRRDAEAPLPPIRQSNLGTNNHLRETGKEGFKSSSFGSAIGAWLTKLSPKNVQQSSVSTKAQESNGPMKEGYGNVSARDKRVRSISSESSLQHSESTELLSMYSNVSSLATGNSSFDENSANRKDNDHGRPFHETAHGPQSFNKAKIDEGKLDTDSTKPKKKLLSPVELKYTNLVKEGKAISTLFKPVIIPSDSMMKKVEDANVSWSVTTARLYDKPLPNPNSEEVDSLIEDLHYDTLGLGSSDVIEFNMEVSDPNATLQSFGSYEPLIPIPRFEIFTGSATNSLNNATGDSELLRKFRDFTLKKDENNDDMLNNANIKSPASSPNNLDNLEKNSLMRMKTRLNKIATAVRIFNKTLEEQNEYLNFSDQNSLFMDFEVRPPTYSNITNMSA